MLKPALIVAAAALAGGLIGQSQILCPTGYCPLTGSWYGGAAFGGLLALVAVSDGGNPFSRRRDQAPPDDAS